MVKFLILSRVPVAALTLLAVVRAELAPGGALELWWKADASLVRPAALAVLLLVAVTLGARKDHRRPLGGIA